MSTVTDMEVSLFSEIYLFIYFFNSLIHLNEIQLTMSTLSTSIMYNVIKPSMMTVMAETNQENVYTAMSSPIIFISSCTYYKTISLSLCLCLCVVIRLPNFFFNFSYAISYCNLRHQSFSEL